MKCPFCINGNIEIKNFEKFEIVFKGKAIYRPSPEYYTKIICGICKGTAELDWVDTIIYGSMVSKK